jgi:hypothetical protein
MRDDGLADPVPKLGAWFNALHGGECEGCGDYFEAGDRVRFVNDDIHCGDCGEAAEDE